MKCTPVEVVAAMMREADYQDVKRPYRDRPLAEWLLIMRAELAEAEDAWVKGRGVDDDPAVLCELLQVMTVGMRCLCQHGVVGRGT